jgi:hypothetical protein
MHVEQRERELVDWLAVKARRVDPLAVRQQDRIGRRLELQRRSWVGGEVSLGGHPVDL